MEIRKTLKLLRSEEKANLKILTFSAMFFFVSLIISLMILPGNCSLLENDPEGPWFCHTIPNNCCVNRNGRLLARSIAFAGLGLAVAPFIFAFVNSQKSKDKFKIFD
jgi:hypothetical protein